MIFDPVGVPSKSRRLSHNHCFGLPSLNRHSQTVDEPIGAALAIFISYTSILSIGDGLPWKRNSIITGCLIAGSLRCRTLLSARTFTELIPVDLLFVSRVISSIINSDQDVLNELLLAKLFAYVACP